MNPLFDFDKYPLPLRVRQFLQRRHRNFVFRRAMRRFLKDPAACASAGNPVLRDLVYGWGNEVWSALDEYLAACVRHALNAKGPTFECGSGLSTILIGAASRKTGNRHWAMEHMPDWAARVRKYLERYQLETTVVLHDAPLKDHGEFCWYDAPTESMPDSFSLVVCDGPPGATKGGRYGLVPVLGERMQPNCVVLLDDIGRDAEREIANRWESELVVVSRRTLGPEKPFLEMVVSGYAPQVDSRTR